MTKGNVRNDEERYGITDQIILAEAVSPECPRKDDTRCS